MILRLAHLSDAAALADLINPWIRDSIITFNSVEKTQGDIEALITDRRAAGFEVFVATGSERELLGYATYAQFRGGVGYAHAMEHSIALAPEVRGRGVGCALMAALEDHALRRGAHQMIAGISGENAAGRAFHAALGYAHIATVTEAGRKFDRWHDLVLMRKFLT
jgi:phosphinothricin acetyltransferase